MNNISIQKTNSTPEILFLIKGELKITGRSLPEDVNRFYDPLIDWVKLIDIEYVKLDLKLEYMNTSSTKKILSLLTSLDGNEKINKIDINWFYEFDDTEMEDLGEIYKEEIKRASFNLVEGVDIF